jgi:uncharacterized membrane protein YjjP (DUF1212 family)
MKKVASALMNKTIPIISSKKDNNNNSLGSSNTSNNVNKNNNKNNNNNSNSNTIAHPHHVLRKSWDLNLRAGNKPPSPLSSPAIRRGRPTLNFREDSESSSDDESNHNVRCVGQSRSGSGAAWSSMSMSMGSLDDGYDDSALPLPHNQHRRKGYHKRAESLPTPTDEQEMKRLLNVQPGGELLFASTSTDSNVHVANVACASVIDIDRNNSNKKNTTSHSNVNFHGSNDNRANANANLATEETPLMVQWDDLNIDNIDGSSSSNIDGNMDNDKKGHDDLSDIEDVGVDAFHDPEGGNSTFGRSRSSRRSNRSKRSNATHTTNSEEGGSEDEGHTLYGTVIETVGDAVTEAWNYIEDTKEEVWEEYSEKSHYDWREFWRGGGTMVFVRWLLTGFAANAKLNDDEIQDNLNSLAHLLVLLREYHAQFGMPSKGGHKDREYVLRETIKDLYAGGAPVWTLQPVMAKIAEGLTGKRGLDFFLLPRRAFIFAPSSGATIMFPISRGIDMQKLDEMEKVAVRLASFASNSSSVANIPARWPNPRELRQAFRAEDKMASNSGCVDGIGIGSAAGSASAPMSPMPMKQTQEEMAEEILNLASEAEGLFFFINSHKYKQAISANANVREMAPTCQEQALKHNNSELIEFWHVEEDIQELFCRLAAVEAITSIDKIDVERTIAYSPTTILMFRFGSAAGACAFWFRGSWYDMLVAGTLSIMVAYIGASPLLSKQERIIFEVVASFTVGLVSAVLSLTWPAQLCFPAIGISALLDVLQGYRVVYAIMEIMSRHTVTGGSDLMEGIFFTALIAYFLKFGQFAALSIMGMEDVDPITDTHVHVEGREEYMTCDAGISEWWFLLFVPISAICWSGLFNPSYYDLPTMAAHGVIGYVVSWQFDFTAPSSSLNNFLAAAAITFCAGLVSRFTGRQALGNTVAGLYVLVPGVYMLTTVYSNKVEGFLTSIVLRAVIIGIGAWTGTVMCSPTVLGTNRGLMNNGGGVGLPSDSSVGSINSYLEITSTASGNWKRRDKAVRKQGTGALLFF